MNQKGMKAALLKSSRKQPTHGHSAAGFVNDDHRIGSYRLLGLVASDIPLHGYQVIDIIAADNR